MQHPIADETAKTAIRMSPYFQEVLYCDCFSILLRIDDAIDQVVHYGVAQPALILEGPVKLKFNYGTVGIA